MKGIKFTLRIILSAILIMFLVFSPAPLMNTLEHNYYREWLSGEKEEWGGVITIWHVVEFKTYQGSVTAYLENILKQYEKKHSGVYVEVQGLTAEEVEERMAQGQRPDIWSFASGAVANDVCRPLLLEQTPAFVGNLSPVRQNDAVIAVPYLFSGYFLLGNTVLIPNLGLSFPDMSIVERMRAGDYAALQAHLQSAMEQRSTSRYGALCITPFHAARLGLKGKLASDGDFKAGQVPFYIADARAYGDLHRKMASGGFTLDVLPLNGFTEQVQYIGPDREATEQEMVHITGMIALLLSESAQAKLTALGALPVIELSEPPQYADSLLQSFYESYRMPIVPDPILWRENRGALFAEATRIVEGNAAGTEDFQLRLQQCIRK